ncbi:MAG: twin-arginine translocase TatA/TatE family subunit [Chloroflexia bacterium]
MGFEVFGVGVPEMVIILVVALIFLGPDKLPEAARTVGGWVREIRSFTGEAASIWQETMAVGEGLKDSVRPASLLGLPPTSAPPPPLQGAETVYKPAAETAAQPAAPLAVAYTPPSADGAPPEAGPPGTLEYPNPFEAPAPTKPAAETLDYPAPF